MTIATKKVLREALRLPEEARATVADRLLKSLEEGRKRPERLGWPLRFFERTYGSLADVPLERPPQGVLEARERL